MRHTIRTCLCLLLLSGIFAAGSRAGATTHDPEKGGSAFSLRDGGDVLRPERTSSSEYFWFIGIDGGITYSRFQNGPVSFFMPNPYHVSNPFYGPMYNSPFPHAYPLTAAADEGDGVGLYLGLTLDFPLSNAFGLVIKGNYHNRTGGFSLLTDLGEVHPDTETDLTTVLEHETDWTFDYLGFDMLLRIQPLEIPLYGLIGPSIGILSSNTAELTQRIVQPEDLFYTEWLDGQEVISEFTSASSEEEIAGFMDTRIDLKLGFGYMIELSESLFLVPEVTVAVPMSAFIDSVNTADHNVDPPIDDNGALIGWENGFNEPIVGFNNDFNVITTFITIGLRWRID